MPCELWFLNRNKPEEHQDKVLMLDARNVYRKVTRKIYDFSPEQEQNLLAIIWLYRGETERYLELVSDYLGQAVDEAQAYMDWEEDGESRHPLPDYLAAIHALQQILQPILAGQLDDGSQIEQQTEFDKEYKLLVQDIARFHQRADEAQQQWENAPDTNAALVKLTKQFEPFAESSRDLIKQTDLLYKLAGHLIDQVCSPDRAKRNPGTFSRDITRARKAADEARQQAVEQLKQVRYFWRQAHWLTERFPGAKLRDVEGLVKLVDCAEIEANDWSLTPGRYVGVAPEEEDDDFDFEEALREIHVELEDLNAEAVQLAATIKRNFEELGV